MISQRLIVRVARVVVGETPKPMNESLILQKTALKEEPYLTLLVYRVFDFYSSNLQLDIQMLRAARNAQHRRQCAYRRPHPCLAGATAASR